MQPISGLVITYNEAGNIRACLESLQAVCAEIIVVDSGSTDDTVAIAKACGAKVHTQPFLGYGPQKNVGVHLCQHAWVLSLDADERLDTDAIGAIQALDLIHSPYEAYELRRKNLFHGRWVQCTAWYPDRVRRL
ncbi:MAG: glycosyltransferase family 2 protein, partial [Thiothrix sp.]